MLKLAIDCGYPSVRLMLRQLTWREHRELNDLLSTEPVGGERLDWHFARLMQLMRVMLGSGEEDELPPLKDWFLESMIHEAPEPEPDEEGEAAFLDATLAGFLSTRGLVVAGNPQE